MMKEEKNEKTNQAENGIHHFLFLLGRVYARDGSQNIKFANPINLNSGVVLTGDIMNDMEVSQR